MDGDDVNDSPSEAVQKSFTEIFIDVFPYYLAMGMSAQEFWHGPPSLARAYRKAAEIERDKRNWEMWLQGAYIYDALTKVMPITAQPFTKTKIELGKYPDIPYAITEDEVYKREQQEEQAKIDRLMESMNAISKREIERRQSITEGGEADGRPNREP